MPMTDRGAGLDCRLIVVAALTGVAAGIGGIALTLLLHLTQHLAFGYTEATFLTGVERAAPARRVLALTIGGLVVGLGWYALRRWAHPIDGVRVVMGTGGPMPIGPVTAEASLQILAVGFGASLGREGAPRLLGGALAARLADLAGLDAGRRRTIVACGAGAGLACVYNVPLGGALFALEILLASAAITDVVPALLSSGIATAVAWPVLSTRPTYLVQAAGLQANELVFALLLGPVAGLAGAGFNRLVEWSRSLAPTGWRVPVSVTAVFAGVGSVSIIYPQLLGNGKGPAQLALDGSLGLLTLGALLLLKPIVTAACLGSGAHGGLLTPALATGALLGALTGDAWSMLWPGTPTAGFALIGAAAVLATTQRAPLCAIVLVLEFTHTGVDLLVPIALAVGGAMVTSARLTMVPLLGRLARGHRGE